MAVINRYYDCAIAYKMIACQMCNICVYIWGNIILPYDKVLRYLYKIFKKYICLYYVKSLCRKCVTWNYHEIGTCDYNVYVLHTENILFCLLLSIAKNCKLYKLFCSQSPCNIKYFFTFFWYDIFICLQYICALCYICQFLSSSIQGGAICLWNICIVLDLAVGVAVCKASVLDWLGRAYAQLHCAMLIYMQCSSMQGIYAQLTREGLFLIALCCGKFSVCQRFLVYW